MQLSPAVERYVLHWGETVRQRWCFQYFGAEAPSDKTKEIQE